MTQNEQIKIIMSTLDKKEQEKITIVYSQLKEIVLKNENNGLMALALLGSEIAE